MSYPDRRADRSLLSRRSPEQQQQHSPFRRALYDKAGDIDIPRAQSPSNRTSPRHQRHFSQTGTLRGAFEATRVPTVQEDSVLTSAYARRTPSPDRRMRMPTSTSPESNPPDELVETYRRINEDQYPVDAEEFEIPGDMDNGLRINGSSLGGYYSQDEHLGPFATGEEASFLDDAVDESPRRNNPADHVNDEMRLRRATTSHSPVFSRARVGALTSEDLQRHDNNDDDDEDDEAQGHIEEDDRGPEPSLNLPTTWGSRGTHRRDWMRNINRRRSETAPRKEVDEKTSNSALEPRSRLDSRTDPAQTTERSPRRTSLETRNIPKERSTSGYNRPTPGDERNRPVTEHKEQQQQSTHGGVIPNTPISIYKNSTFSRRSPAKRDSQDLLRRLSRAESPRVDPSANQMKTPEPTKPFERHIYDKTPVVTGAWIDTPMTEKATKLPEHLPNNIVPERESHTYPRPQPESQPPQEKEKESAEEKQAEEQREEKEPKKTKPPVIKPELPKSGLETFIRDFQANEDSQPLGDDTIESLEMLLDEGNEPNESNGRPVEVKSEAEEDAAFEKAILKKLEHAKPDKEVDLEVFHNKLESLVHNMNEVKTGFQGFEDRVKEDADIMSRATTTDSTKSKGERSLKHTHADENCEACGSRNDGRLYATIPLPCLWKRSPISRRIRPTRLGWCTLLFTLWLFSESTMCDYYCHPTYATVCHGNCLRPDAPQFPYALPTMLWRWSHLSQFLAPVFTLVLAVGKFIANLLGLWDGFVDDAPPRALNLAGEIRIRGTRIAGFPGAATSAPEVQRQQQQPPPPWQGWPDPGLGQDAPPPVQWENEQSSMEDDELL